MSFEGQPLGVLCRVETTESEERAQEAMRAASLAALTVHNGHRYVNAGRVSKTLPKASHGFHQWIPKSLHRAPELPREQECLTKHAFWMTGPPWQAPSQVSPQRHSTQQKTLQVQKPNLNLSFAF